METIDNSQTNDAQSLLAIKDKKIQELERQIVEVLAENASLKKYKDELLQELNRVWGRVAVYLNKNKQLQAQGSKDLQGSKEDELEKAYAIGGYLAQIEEFQKEIGPLKDTIKEQEELLDKREDQMTKYLSELKPLRKKVKEQEDVIHQLESKLKLDYHSLVKRKEIDFRAFDPERFKVEKGGLRDGYFFQHNWVFIGSLGDPETWEGTSTNVAIKQNKGSASNKGLFGTLIDMNVMQEILYQRPSGKNSLNWHFTHRLQSVLFADSNSIIDKETILKQIKATAKEAKVNPAGVKYMNLYYSGHGEEHTGNWVFKDGVITLQDVIDQLDADHVTYLHIYSDCCYSGNWAKALDQHKEQFKEDKDEFGRQLELKEDYDQTKILKKTGEMIEVYIYAACAHDEVATENVFTDLLKGQLPDDFTFPKLKQLIYEDWEEGYEAEKLKDQEARKIGENQHLTYGWTRIYDESMIEGWKK